MRKAVSSSEVAHLWAHQIQEEAYEKGRGNIYFSGESIYSYGSHYEVGRIVKNKKGEIAYVINDRGYSSTTGKHIRLAIDTIPASRRVFYAWGTSGDWWSYRRFFPTEDSKVAIGRWVEEIAKEVARLHRAKSWGVNELYPREPLRQIASWVEFWGLTKTEVRSIIRDVLKSTNLDKKHHASLCHDLMDMAFNGCEDIRACYGELYDSVYGEGSFSTKMESVDRKRAEIAAAREAQYALWREQRAEEERISALSDEERLEKYHNGETYGWRPSSIFENEHGWHTALRVNSHRSLVESSKGIRVNLKEAKRLWTVFKAYHAGHEFSRDLVTDANGHKWRCDSYKNDVFSIGCHKIPFSEAERVAKALGWA